MRALLAASCLAVVTGCSPCDYRGQEAERYEGGRVLPSGTSYETGAPDELLLPFPAGQTYDLVHGLGVVPTSVQGYVSFAPQLTEDGDPLDHNQPNNVAETAGNQLVIERWDDEIVRVRNDTCAPFYLRVVLVADPSASVTGQAGAGGN
jgi:hypothetical protein